MIQSDLRGDTESMAEMTMLAFRCYCRDEFRRAGYKVPEKERGATPSRKREQRSVERKTWVFLSR